MSIAALILGILGGIWELILGILVATAGSLISGIEFFGDTGSAIIAIGVVIIILSICGIVGGGVVMSKAKAGGILILVAALGMIVLAIFDPSWVTIVPALILITGGVLGLVVSRQT